MHATFKIMLPTEGGEHIFKKANKNKEKRAQRAIKRQRKQQMAHDIHKIAAVMHTVIFAERPRRRKVHETAARNYFLKGGMQRKNSEPNEQWSNKGEQKWQKRLL